MSGRVLMHPFVLGELALGQLKPRGTILQLPADFPQASVADDNEVLNVVRAASLHISWGRVREWVDERVIFHSTDRAISRYCEGREWKRTAQPPAIERAGHHSHEVQFGLAGTVGCQERRTIVKRADP